MMIRKVRCPYCGDVSAVVDIDQTELVIAPHRAGDGPCQHLACLAALVLLYRKSDHRVVAERSAEWLWEPEAGLKRFPPWQTDYLYKTVVITGCGEHLDAPEYRIGGTASECGTEDLSLPPSGEGTLYGEYGTYALYSLARDELVTALRRSAAEDEAWEAGRRGEFAPGSDTRG